VKGYKKVFNENSNSRINKRIVFRSSTELKRAELPGVRVAD
jgi:hypothetical protein